ncbi:MAG: PilC/PilY family type IV pilus protein [Geothrix sp.]|nr:PilC/PilY family type IV pilus protein [Geothrix sp.]
MNHHRRTFIRLLAGLLLGSIAAIQPLSAQLDPKLQGSKTDFLDLYQQSVNLVMKPEVVSVFDFSGSMAATMYHREYVYPVNTDTSDGGGGAGMRFTRTSPALNRYDVTVSLATTTALSNGKLVRPDGSLLEFASGGDQAINSNYVVSTPLLGGESTAIGFLPASDVRNWIRSASHVRFTSNGRTYDLPLCWTILDDPSVQPNVAAGQFRKMYNTYPLKMTIINPGTAANTEIEMDSSYRVASQVADANFGMFDTTVGTAPMTDCTLGRQYYFIYWKSAYITWLFNTATSVIQSTLPGGRAFAQGVNPDPAIAANAIPARTRTQGTKDAAMRTWAKYHNKVFWAYRFLKYFAPDSGNAQYDSAVFPSNDSRNNKNVSDPTLVGRYGQSDRGWVLLNSNSDTGLKRLAALMAMGSTTLNSALANTYAQLNDPNCIFNDIETGVDKPVECRNTYVMLFTDGVPNTDPGTPENTNTPYVGLEPSPAVATYGTANTGNAFFAANKTRIDTTNGTPYFNVINLAALAAHGGETDNGGWTAPIYPTTTQTYPTTPSTWKPSDWIPFWIRSRGAGTEKVTFTKPRPITTMTIGVSLTGVATISTHPKRRLFLAAAFGDPARKTWDVSTLTEFTLNDPTDPSKGKTPSSTYFFDATDPDKLTKSLDAAFYELSLASNVNATSNPNLPFVGASFGSQIYLGKFQPPSAGGAVWPGDVLMFGTREVSGQTVIIDKTGNVTTTTDETTAQWSAKDALLNARLWSARKLYTRLPGATVLKPFTDIGTEFTDPATGLQKFVATSLTNLIDKQHVVQFAAGGDLTKPGADGRPTANRLNIMGDVINSAPAAIEFNWNDVKDKLAAYPRLTAMVSAVAGANRFRLLVVGTNQGWLHAFGEVTLKIPVVDANGVPWNIVKGDVEELWSFMPTDLLANLNYMTVANNPHRFMVDGTSGIYHLDLPPITGGAGNGLVDATERAVAVFGLRKGGRSYYALDIHDPFVPALKWSMVPDEAATLPADRIVAGGPTLATVSDLLGKWGFSSCTPAFGRIQFNSVIRDAVFLGGGFSVPEIEVNFANAKLGRSVMALDVYSGEVLAASNLTDPTLGGATIGPIGAGVVPFEFVVNSGMAQRAYFMDYKGGLWAWGSKAVSPNAPYVDFRVDTSQITDWTIRKVYQDDDIVAKGARYTTLPAPFRVGSFPGVGKPGSAAPAAAGIAVVSGDRNNPLDREYDAATNPAPVNHRLTVVFDRQDSRAWGFDTVTGPDAGIKNLDLKNFSANIVSATPVNACSDLVFGSITPGCPNYYLAPYSGTPPAPLTPAFGYYLNFPSITADGFIPKGINPPLVVANSLFYAYFTPATADPCTGGTGNTYSYLTTNVMNPLVTDTRAGLVSTSGLKYTWSGVASDFFAIGTRAVLQVGAIPVVNPQVGQSATTMGITTIQGSATQRFPKPRVWRTVH